ncbi:tripartite tricarboxylate transporter permease [Martelella limonii]|uniref:tripartite tricarboxylate transporter permease n=1 Tax=Martelella limonii TaxID=1647649 RepID=UPI001580867F|nr:tripartite tricarboxylate transporter permease [Martelella limonii]
MSDEAREILPRLSEWKGRFGQLLRCSGIGCLIGALPGTVASTAAFIAYALAKRSSKNSANFGKGEPDGLIAAESSNNAVTGSAMIPTLALGIPGDVITAILMSALVIQGITPGVRLMSENAVTDDPRQSTRRRRCRHLRHCGCRAQARRLSPRPAGHRTGARPRA